MAREVSEKKTAKEFSGFLDQFGKALFAEKDLLETLQSSPDDPKVRFYLTILNQLTNDPVSCFPTYRFAKQKGLGEVKLFHQSPRPFSTEYGYYSSTDEQLFQFLKHSGILAEISNYETFPRSDFPYFEGGRVNSFAALFFSNLKDGYYGEEDEKRRVKIRAEVEKLCKKPTFGRLSHGGGHQRKIG